MLWAEIHWFSVVFRVGSCIFEEGNQLFLKNHSFVLKCHSYCLAPTKHMYYSKLSIHGYLLNLLDPECLLVFAVSLTWTELSWVRTTNPFRSFTGKRACDSVGIVWALRNSELVTGTPQLLLKHVSITLFRRQNEKLKDTLSQSVYLTGVHMCSHVCTCPHWNGISSTTLLLNES